MAYTRSAFPESGYTEMLKRIWREAYPTREEEAERAVMAATMKEEARLAFMEAIEILENL